MSKDTVAELKKLALRHPEAHQSAGLQCDLARRDLPSDKPYAHGDRAFFWIDDKAKYKDVGRWASVISQSGANIVDETDKAVLRANHSMLKSDHDAWHVAPLRKTLEILAKEVPFETALSIRSATGPLWMPMSPSTMHRGAWRCFFPSIL